MRNFSSLLRVGLVTLMLLPGLSAVANLGLGLNSAKAAQIAADGVVYTTGDTDPERADVSFTVPAQINIGQEIVLKFNPVTMPIDAAGTDAQITGAGTTTLTRTNNSTDNTITLTVATANISAAAAVTIRMDDALNAAYTSTAYAIDWIYVSLPADYAVAEVSNPVAAGLTDLDSVAVLEDQVLIRAEVPAYITLGLSGNLVDLGILSNLAVNQGTLTLTLNTNDASGATISFDADANLNTAANTASIANTPNNTNVVAGTNAYGFSATTSGVTLLSIYNAAGDDPIPTGGFADLAEVTGPVTNGTVTMTFKASIDSSVAQGQYDQVITFLAAVDV